MSGMHASRTLSCADNGAVDSSRLDAAKMKTAFDILVFSFTQLSFASRNEAAEYYWH
jgi:hypothetical protein